MTDLEGYVCICPALFTGPNCSIRRKDSPCIPNPCLGPAKTSCVIDPIEFERGYICVGSLLYCTLCTKVGHCSLIIVIQIATQNGSYVPVDDSHLFFRMIEKPTTNYQLNFFAVNDLNDANFFHHLLTATGYSGRSYG